MDNAMILKEAILDGLRSGRWPPGHRIPTERQFSEEFGLGRSVVRRVLSQLKEQRVIHQVVGSGTFVSEDLPTGQVRRDEPLTHQTSPAELMESRLALEPAIVELVVAHATTADFERMEMCCGEAEAALGLEDFEHWDRALHEAIAEAAHNQFVLNLFGAMSRARSQAEWGLLKRRSLTSERRLDYQLEHRAMVSALKDRDLSAAAELTRRHLLHVRMNLLGY